MEFRRLRCASFGFVHFKPYVGTRSKIHRSLVANWIHEDVFKWCCFSETFVLSEAEQIMETRQVSVMAVVPSTRRFR